MAGAIRSAPATAEYRGNFERSMRRLSKPVEVPGPNHECGRCGKVLAAGHECACSALRAGGAGRYPPCGRCGRQVGSASARLCDSCEFHRRDRRR